jgi:hypothetical protein
MPQHSPLPTIQQATLQGTPVNVLTTVGKNKVPYLELLTYSEAYTDSDLSATRTCLCLWEDRYKFRDDMLGTSTYAAGHTVGGVASGIVRRVPEQHPEQLFLYANGCTLSGAHGVPTSTRDTLMHALTSQPQYGVLVQVNPTSNMVGFNLAEWQVTYGPRDGWDVLDEADVPANGQGEMNRYLSRFFESAAENQIIPGGAFKFKSDERVIYEPPAKTFPTLELQYIWREVPLVPILAIQLAQGSCNATAFDNGFWPAQTLLCQTPKYRRYRTKTGDWVYDITYIFTFKRQTWNTLFRRDVPVGGGPDPVGGPGFDAIIGNDDVTLATPTSDFGKLFFLP